MSTGSEKASSESSKKMKGKGGRANKKILIIVAVIVALVLAGSGVLIALVSASNAKAAEEFAALSKDCATVRSNLNELSSWPGFLSELESASDGFIRTNLGNASRGEYKEAIVANFPYLETLDRYESNGALWLIQMGIAGNGTRFQTDFTKEQIATFLADPDARSEYESSTFGYLEYSDAERKMNETLCAGVDVKENRDRSDNGELSTLEALGAWDFNAGEVLAILTTIQDCEKEGTCAAADYDGSRADYSPLPPRNPFVDPFTDKWLQETSVFFWCANLGLEANETFTDCE